MDANTDISRQASAPLTPYERAMAGLALLLPLLSVLAVGVGLAMLGGCKAFYENAGMHVRMGSLTAPVEVSDPSEALTVRALYSMDGIDMYAAKGAVAHMSYTNIYSNSFAYGLFNWAGAQHGDATIEPVEDSAAPTNAVTAAGK